ncbi:CD2-associated protein isoform X3 [Ascaphus truei]|uniref:CD2-associated protein isoform X3 n=1 Tax=Ascaphus truei TaxID=8439 RepID=UPI003F5A9996
MMPNTQFVESRISRVTDGNPTSLQSKPTVQKQGFSPECYFCLCQVSSGLTKLYLELGGNTCYNMNFALHFGLFFFLLSTPTVSDLGCVQTNMSLDLEIKREPEPKEESLPAKRDKAGNVASLVQRMSTYGLPGMGLHPQPKAFKKKSKKRQCKVIFEYIPLNEDELELKVGDVLDITEEVEEGWWNGSLNGKSGLFPSNFVKEVELSDDGESQDIPEDTETAAATPASPVLSSGNGSEVLSVAQPKKIRGIGFGDIFKEGSVKLKPRMSSSEVEEKKPEKPLPTQPSITKLPHTPCLEIPRTETDSKPKAKEFCRALYSYEGSNEDELSFKEGDTIQLISKDTGDPGWWKGECNGKEGVFPDNFAAIIQDYEKEKPKKPPPPKSPAAPRPELRMSEKRFTPTKPEEKDEKPFMDLRPSKPAGPQVPPKKPVLPNKSNNILKPVIFPPKRPEKPALPISKPNGDSPLNRPKSEGETLKAKIDLEQILIRSKSIEVEPSAVRSPKENELLSFDDVLSTSENLSHPTANRPKMPGKRLPGRFNGCTSPCKDVTDSSKVHKQEEEESAKAKPPEVKKPPALIASPIFTPLSVSILPRHTSTPLSPLSLDDKVKADTDGKKSEVEELKVQINELLTVVEALQKEHRKEMDKIKRDLEEEKMLRSNLENEIEKLKRAIQLT